MTVSRLSLFALVLVVAGAAPAQAQSATSGKWEVEAHGGGIWASNSTSGAAATLPAATPFSGAPLITPSRHESSYLFGDGSTLLNSVIGALRSTAQIVPLDPVLTAAAAHRSAGASAGARIARRFGSRYSAEFSIDYAAAPLEFTAKATDAIEASRASFETAMKGLFATGPFVTTSVTATKTSTESGGHQLVTTGVLTYDLVTHGRLIPYAEGGIGVVNNQGDTPQATIKGNYSTSVVGVFSINETDTVAIHLAPHNRDVVGVFGGGVRCAMSSRWGIRADVRALVGGGKVDTTLDASPSVQTQTPPGFIASSTNPSIVFANNSITGVQSTLSGPAISGLKTFSASGTAIRTNVVAGVYFRF